MGIKDLFLYASKDAKVKGMKDEGTRYRDWPLPTLQLSRHPPAVSVVAGLTEPGGPRHPRRSPTWMVKGEGRFAFLPLASLASLARTRFGAGEENRAKDAKVKGTPIKGLGSYSFTRRRGGAEGAEAPRDGGTKGQVL